MKISEILQISWCYFIFINTTAAYHRRSTITTSEAPAILSTSTNVIRHGRRHHFLDSLGYFWGSHSRRSNPERRHISISGILKKRHKFHHAALHKRKHDAVTGTNSDELTIVKNVTWPPLADQMRTTTSTKAGVIEPNLIPDTEFRSILKSQTSSSSTDAPVVDSDGENDPPISQNNAIDSRQFHKPRILDKNYLPKSEKQKPQSKTMLDGRWSSWNTRSHTDEKVTSKHNVPGVDKETSTMSIPGGGLHSKANHSSTIIEKMIAWKDTQKQHVYDWVKASPVWVGVGAGLCSSVVLTILLSLLYVTCWKRRSRCRKLSELSVGTPTEEKPIYIKLSQLHRPKRSPNYVVTVLDESNFSIHSDGDSSEEELFDLSAIATGSPYKSNNLFGDNSKTSTPIKENNLKTKFGD